MYAENISHYPYQITHTDMKQNVHKTHNIIHFGMDQLNVDVCVYEFVFIIDLVVFVRRFK